MFLPKKKKKSKKIILGLVLVFLLGWFWYSYSLNTPVSTDSQTQEFKVESGWGSTKISEELKDVDLIRSPLIFQFYTWKKGISSRLQDGEYFLTKNLNIKEIAQILTRGAGATKELSLTFIEGWNNQDYAEYLEEQGIASETDFFDIIQKKADWWNEYKVLVSRPSSADLEGYLFPDTYRIFRDASIKDIVQKMLANLENKITPELMEEIKNQGKSVHEILTLASVLEKEVISDQDRKIVAGIFYKRLDIGMPLQADSTVNYVTGKSVSRASATDLDADSPYNTYKYRGLPPGPICNPSVSAIKAAIYPTKNNYFLVL